MDNLERVRIAYKKLKANLYFDKTQLPLRDRLVLFEREGVEERLRELYTALMEDGDWAGYEARILEQIGVLLYPKKLEEISENAAVFNADNIPIKMAAPQYFLDLPVEGHLLGALWVLSIGMALDKNSDEDNPNGMYEYSYGNRLKRTLLNEDSGDITYSPSLFEPYFAQYENWRDYALEKAKERLNDKQDAMILTLDFKSFYYSVCLGKEHFESFLARLGDKQLWHDRVNQFVFKVICRYSNELRKVMMPEHSLYIGERNVLPIGFLPSNILSNWVLTAFDNAIIEKWNPIYYGRYVDDIIIVNKVERNDPLYKRAHARDASELLSADDVIKIELIDRNILIQNGDGKRGFDGGVKGKTYRVSEDVLICKESLIQVQEEKAKLFYFQAGATQALLDCFKNQIAQNASEFRLMPDMEVVLKYRNYSEMFQLRNAEGIQKFRGIVGIDLDKFVLSKFLGKYCKISGLIESDEERTFEQDLMVILDERTLIANYGVWERLFEILVINKRYDLYKTLAVRIMDALKKYEVPQGVCCKGLKTHDALLRVFLSALHRTSAVAWNEDFDQKLKEICAKAKVLQGDERFSAATLAMLDQITINSTRKAYCATRMINKYILPLPVDCVLEKVENGERIDLSDLWDVLKQMNATWLTDATYIYYPYMITPQELSFALACKALKENEQSIDPKKHQKTIDRYFCKKNFPNLSKRSHKTFELESVKSEALPEKAGRKLFYTEVSNGKKTRKDKIRVAVGNVKLSVDDFICAVQGKPRRRLERYGQFEKMSREAVQEKADMLVLPESFLPYEWIPEITRFCAKNHLALISGVEHIRVDDVSKKSNGIVYNLTVTILPYQYAGHPFASVSYHNKVSYSPREKKEIVGRRCSFKEGDTYQLFGWHNVWFPVYCCFELASIHDRGLFQSYADMVVAVEWNKDVQYYSSIIQSLARDLHCYCIQVNSSDYGDSRIVAPQKTDERDIVRTKGGINACVLIDDIDICALREFQMLEYTLQEADKNFKPTPPGMDPDGVIQKKLDNELFL